MIECEQKATRGKALLTLRIERANGEVKECQIPNTRTDAGALWVYNCLTEQGTTGAGVFIAMSRDIQDIAKNLTALTSEHTSNGIGRGNAQVQNYTAPTVADGVASYQLSRTLVYTGISSDTIASVGVFDAIAGGSLIWVFNVTPSEIINLNDRVTLLVTINI